MVITEVKQLHVYELAFENAMEVFEQSKAWPKEERYALTDQIRRSSRVVCANLSEGWAKRRYPKHFASKLSDAHAEAEETLTWLRFANRCGYLDTSTAEKLAAGYRQVIAGLVRMIADRHRWCAPAKR